MHKPKLNIGARILAVVALTTLVLACGSKINQQNYDRIAVGMTREEVTAILGEPTDSSAVGVGGFSAQTATWKAKDGTQISVQFLNDKLKARQISKP